MVRVFGIPQPGNVQEGNAPISAGTVWDATGCSIATGTCPNLPNYNNTGNVSVGVAVLGDTVISISGLPGQGTCVDPLVSQAQHIGISIYFELTWIELSTNSWQGGIGVCDIGIVGQWDTVAANGSGAIMLTPGGQVFVNGARQKPPGMLSSWITPMKSGDTVGVSVDLTQNQLQVEFVGVGGSIVQQEASGSFILNGGPYVPFAAFDDLPQSALVGIKANFGDGGFSSFLGPKLNPPISATNADFYGWPNV